MFGTFQQTTLRIETEAATEVVRDSLLKSSQFKQWLWPQTFSEGLPDSLATGTVFTAYLGPLKIQHRVEALSDQKMQLLLSGGIDGFHEWCWGSGWVQSQLEGISVLPLNLAQSANLWRLQGFLKGQQPGITDR